MSYRILSIDGGGILGLIPAMVLAEIEARTGLLVSDLFDSVSGTSTGGIITCAGAVGIPAQKVANLYRQRGGEIFSRPLLHRLITGWGLWGAQYSAAGLEAALFDVFQGLKLSDCATTLLVPAYDIEARTSVFFKSVKARWAGVVGIDAHYARSRDYYLRDVARATSAAPTFFPPARIISLGGTVVTAVDGGLYANNPSTCALAQVAKASRMYGAVMVSLGTGSRQRPYLYNKARHWGVPRWARPLLDCMFDGQSDTASHQAQALLRDKYFRLQPALANDIAMDDASPQTLELLEAVARGFIAEQDGVIDKICEMLLPKAA